MAVNDVVEREERPAYVRFETRAEENKRESLKQKRVVYEDVDYALITPPYSKDEVVKKVDKWLENVRQQVRNGRTPEKWYEHWQESYKRYKNKQEAPINGTPIKDWSAITPAQRKTLLAINILAVEDLAQCNDEGLRRIGMGGVELRNKAKAWIQAEKDHGPLVLENASLKQENTILKSSVESLEAKVRALSARVEAYEIIDETPNELIVESNMITADDLVDEPEDVLSLSDQYEQKFGKKPHHLMKDETIKKKLQE